MAHPFERVAVYETIKAARKTQERSEALGWHLTATGMKLMEEVGEFSEAALIMGGIMTHKTCDSDDGLKEAADVMICLLDILQRIYPNKAPDELYVALSAALDKKRERWINGPKGVNPAYERQQQEAQAVDPEAWEYIKSH